MNHKTVTQAIKAAERFIEAANQIEYHQTGDHKFINPGRPSGTLRRASMDLTRSLTDMRKPN